MKNLEVRNENIKALENEIKLSKKKATGYITTASVIGLGTLGGIITASTIGNPDIIPVISLTGLTATTILGVGGTGLIYDIKNKREELVKIKIKNLKKRV